MAIVRGGVTTQYMKEAALTLSIGLNYTDPSVTDSNKALAKEYSAYHTPIQLSNFQRWNGSSWVDFVGVPNAIVMPPGSSIELAYDYKCHLGFGYKVRLAGKSDTTVCEGWYATWPAKRKADIKYAKKLAKDNPNQQVPIPPEWVASETPQWLPFSTRSFKKKEDKDGTGTIQLSEWKNYRQYSSNVTRDFAKEQFIMEFSAWPISYFEMDGIAYSVPENWLEQHYAGSGSGDTPAVGWQGEARKSFVNSGPSTTEKTGYTMYNIRERKDLALKIQFLALIVVKGNLSNFKLYDWDQQSSGLDD